MAPCRAPGVTWVGLDRGGEGRAARPPAAKVKSLFGESTPRAWSRPARADPDRAPRVREGGAGPAAGPPRGRDARDRSLLEERACPRTDFHRASERECGPTTQAAYSRPTRPSRIYSK